MASLFIGIEGAMAYTLTISTGSSTAGGFQYKLSSSTTWSQVYTTTQTISNVANNTTYVVRAVPNTGYDISRWTEGGTSGTIVSYYHDYTFSVTSDMHLYANWAAAWEGNLESATYTLTSTGEPGDLRFLVTCSNTSSPYHNKTYFYIKSLNVPNGTTAIIHLENSQAVRLKGTIRAYNGGTLRIREIGANRTLQRFFFNGNMIKGDLGSTLDLGNANNTYRLILFSGAEFKNKQNSNMWDARGWNVSDGYGRLVGTHRGIGRCIEANGDLTMNYVTIQGVYNDGSNPLLPHSDTQIGYKIGGAVYCVGNSATPFMMSISNVTIQGCYAPAGTAMYFTNDNHDDGSGNPVPITNLIVSGCYADGNTTSEGTSPGNGIFRATGNCKTSVTMTNCTFQYNKSLLTGGAITWQAGGASTSKLSLNGSGSNKCKIQYNEGGTGGGVYTTTQVDFNAVEIDNNTANNGGGIYIGTYGSAVSNSTDEDNFSGLAPAVSLGANTYIHDNTAYDIGGGIYFRINPSNGVGWNPSGTAIAVEFKVELKGGRVSSNHARLGAGIAIVDTAPRKHKNNRPTLGSGADNPAYNKWSGEYKRSFTIESGSIDGNTVQVHANSTPTYGIAGGGVYIQKGKLETIENGSIGYYYTDSNLGTPSAGTMTIQLKGGSVYENHNDYGNGGGVVVQNYVYTGSNLPSGYTSVSNTTISGSVEIYDNLSKRYVRQNAVNDSTVYPGHGGGLYINGGNVTMTSGTVGKDGHPNQSDGGHGGGMYVADGDVTISGGTVSYNEAIRHPGLAYGCGGGFYVSKGTVTIRGGSTTITNNNAGGSGGGLYVHSGSVEVLNSKVDDNFAKNYGGGLFVNTGSALLTNAYFRRNEAENEGGGGIYVNSGDITLQGSTITNNECGKSGGGILAATGDVNIGCYTYNELADPHTYRYFIPKIQNNTAGHYGGGVAVNNTGNITIQGALIDNNKATNYYGGGIFASNGVVTVEAHEYTETAGANQGTVHTYKPTVNNNEAVRGGGIYSNQGTFNFTDGTINNNKASELGGGLYVAGNSTFNISGEATITGNTVTSNDGNGGGVFQNGIMNANGSAFTVNNNTRGTAKDIVKNNVYLPDTKTIKVGPDISTSVNLGIYTQHTVMENGGNDIPVLTCDEGDQSRLVAIYNAMLTGTSNIRDDRNLHYPVYTGDDATGKTLYFGLVDFDYGPWEEAYEGPISDVETLYQFMCWVNGVNGYGTAHPDATGLVTADIDASPITKLWIPIGEQNIIGETEPYSGNFNGQGHTINGLTINNALYSNFGLFGTTTGANISNVFMTSCDYIKNTTGAMGTIVGNMQGGTLSNCTGSGTLTATSSDCVIGGLVGKLEKDGSASGSIHSSYAGTNQTGYQMGGLVGGLAAGCSVYNSYANASFSPQSGSTKYMGGLVGVNSGTVENCYPRVRGSEPGNTYFGWLAGDNTNGTLNHSYIPTSASTRYTASGKTGTQSGLDNYAPVKAPYLYDHTGDNAVGSSNLLAKLNGWVGTHSGYAPWKRTLAGGTAYNATAGDINGDYPVHQYGGTDCVSASGTNALSIDYTATLDAMLERHTSNATLNLYANDRTNKATGTGVVVYIDENVSLLQTDDTKHIAAHTCQTLPGSPRSWHFVSSSLQDSYIGFSYDHYSTFNWDPDPCGLAFSSDNDQALFPSDMPAVSSMDLYAFYEPEYHWINLKRGSDSHWHMNATTVPIGYNNETTLTRGKGYLVSIDKDQLLQNRGTLNNGNVDFGLDYTPSQAWAGLVGYNLIGNPYQSYLDFSVFASQNSGLWYDGSKGEEVEPTYAVYDAAMGGYIQYKKGSSRGSKSARGILNMHQGFMIRVASAGKSAHFTNDMRTNDGTSTGIREDQPAYPLINLTVTDEEGVNDFAVLELGRDRDEGAEKLRANDSKGWLYLHHGSENYGILFRSEVDDYQPLWFDADEAGSYTLSWETANAEFEALTLVDNITGVETDMLAHDRYTFEATPEQYASRFKIVVGDYKDIEENEAPEPVEGPTFAYVNNGNIVLAGLETEGDASLQVIDMTGRVILCRDASHASAISTDGIASGIYVLRLTDGKGSKIQKIVIE